MDTWQIDPMTWLRIHNRVRAGIWKFIAMRSEAKNAAWTPEHHTEEGTPFISVIGMDDL